MARKKVIQRNELECELVRTILRNIEGCIKIGGLTDRERLDKIRECMQAWNNHWARLISNINVFDVAAYILDVLGYISALKLQKLVYYCQAWSLVWDEQPLFGEDIEAWENGPIIGDLFKYHKGQFTVTNIYKGDSGKLSENEKETIEVVLGYYGDKTAQWLIELAKMEAPWQSTYSRHPMGIIKLDDIAQYYSGL